MNKKFVGATLITATVVGGVVLFRHQVLAQADKALGYLEKKFESTFEEEGGGWVPSEEELAAFEAELEKRKAATGG